MSPLRKRPIAIALTCLMALLASLIAPRPTGLEWPAFSIGLLMAIIFWIDCIDLGNDHEAD
jgi:hypothetical protein